MYGSTIVYVNCATPVLHEAYGTSKLYFKLDKPATSPFTLIPEQAKGIVSFNPPAVTVLPMPKRDKATGNNNDKNNNKNNDGATMSSEERQQFMLYEIDIIYQKPGRGTILVRSPELGEDGLNIKNSVFIKTVAKPELRILSEEAITLHEHERTHRVRVGLSKRPTKNVMVRLESSSEAVEFEPRRLQFYEADPKYEDKVGYLEYEKDILVTYHEHGEAVVTLLCDQNKGNFNGLSASFKVQTIRRKEYFCSINENAVTIHENMRTRDIHVKVHPPPEYTLTVELQQRFNNVSLSRNRIIFWPGKPVKQLVTLTYVAKGEDYISLEVIEEENAPYRLQKESSGVTVKTIEKPYIRFALDNPDHTNTSLDVLPLLLHEAMEKFSLSVYVSYCPTQKTQIEITPMDKSIVSIKPRILEFDDDNYHKTFSLEIRYVGVGTTEICAKSLATSGNYKDVVFQGPLTVKTIEAPRFHIKGLTEDLHEFVGGKFFLELSRQPTEDFDIDIISENIICEPKTIRVTTNNWAKNTEVSMSYGGEAGLWNVEVKAKMLEGNYKNVQRSFCVNVLDHPDIILEKDYPEVLHEALSSLSFKIKLSAPPTKPVIISPQADPGYVKFPKSQPEKDAEDIEKMKEDFEALFEMEFFGGEDIFIADERTETVKFTAENWHIFKPIPLKYVKSGKCDIVLWADKNGGNYTRLKKSLFSIETVSKPTIVVAGLRDIVYGAKPVFDFNVFLSTRPTCPIEVSIKKSNSDCIYVQDVHNQNINRISFNPDNWNTPKALRVRYHKKGSCHISFQCDENGGNFHKITHDPVKVTAIPIPEFGSKGHPEVLHEEVGTAEFKIKLIDPPTKPVRITPFCSDSRIVLFSPTSVWFQQASSQSTSWQEPQTIRMSYNRKGNSDIELRTDNNQGNYHDLKKVAFTLRTYDANDFKSAFGPHVVEQYMEDRMKMLKTRETQQKDGQS
eukprot:Nk52_evm6s634 gene=Nk52_evmTU6s634